MYPMVFLAMARLIHSVHAAYRPHSLSSQLTAFSYLPKTVNTLMLPVDICHLKQTVLIRSSTKCKYQSGQPQHTARKTHYMRQNAVSSTLLSQSRDFFYISCINVVCPLPETRQIQNKTRFKPFLLVSLWGLGCFFSRGPQFRMWRLAKDSSDECESAATDVHTQFLGLNMSLLKNCVWTISR